MNLVGKILAGRYEIVEEIGSGGMAVVYKAKCRILNRYVAIKVLRSDLKDDTDFVRRFNIEAQSAASLTHPNIVSIYDVGTDGDIHYIVMEYVEGITLKEYIDQNGVLNWHEAVGYAIQIASGLEQAHKNSIVHRDIKPHNIIMTPDKVLKITDFGIARASMQSTVTCEDTAIGSVHYVSPEQARGGYVDERSDIYSLGIVLYEMLTGRVPFDNESPVTIALMHLQTKPTPPRELNLSIPKAVEDIVLKAMAKEVSGRYKTITEMKNELVAASNSGGAAPSSPKTAEVDELGGTAIFTAAKDIPETEDIIYTNNQAPSVNSNLVPKPSSKTEEANSPDIELDTEEEEEISVADKKNKKGKKSNKTKTAVIIAALAASLAIIGFLLSMLWPYISDVFSGGSENKTIRIPQFVNRQYNDVIDEYGENKYYEFNVKYTEDTDEEDGFILKQHPAPESEATLKDGKVQITLTVNRLNEETDSDRLDDYVGRDYNKVKRELDALDITVKLKYEFSDSYDEDYIIEQSEPSGTKISKIKTLTLTLSKGKDESTKKDENDNQVSNNDEKIEQTPSPSPSPAENPPETQQANRKRLTIYGPTNKDSAHVEVKVNGKVIKSMDMAKGTSEVVTIQSASSSVNVEVYHDGVLVLTQTVNMTD